MKRAEAVFCAGFARSGKITVQVLREGGEKSNVQGPKPFECGVRNAECGKGGMWIVHALEKDGPAGLFTLLRPGTAAVRKINRYDSFNKFKYLTDLII